MKQQLLTHSDTIELISEYSFNCEYSATLQIIKSIIAFISVCVATAISLNDVKITKNIVPNNLIGFDYLILSLFFQYLT